MFFMTKEVSKYIETKSSFTNKFLKNRTEENKIRYAKQRNECVYLLRTATKKYYGNLHEKKLQIISSSGKL